jgi:hypothetical protein
MAEQHEIHMSMQHYNMMPYTASTSVLQQLDFMQRVLRLKDT